MGAPGAEGGERSTHNLMFAILIAEKHHNSEYNNTHEQQIHHVNNFTLSFYDPGRIGSSAARLTKTYHSVSVLQCSVMISIMCA